MQDDILHAQASVNSRALATSVSFVHAQVLPSKHSILNDEEETNFSSLAWSFQRSSLSAKLSRQPTRSSLKPSWTNKSRASMDERKTDKLGQRGRALSIKLPDEEEDELAPRRIEESSRFGSVRVGFNTVRTPSIKSKSTVEVIELAPELSAESLSRSYNTKQNSSKSFDDLRELADVSHLITPVIRTALNNLEILDNYMEFCKKRDAENRLAKARAARLSMRRSSTVRKIQPKMANTMRASMRPKLNSQASKRVSAGFRESSSGTVEKNNAHSEFDPYASLPSPSVVSDARNFHKLRYYEYSEAPLTIQLLAETKDLSLNLPTSNSSPPPSPKHGKPSPPISPRASSSNPFNASIASVSTPKSSASMFLKPACNPFASLPPSSPVQSDSQPPRQSTDSINRVSQSRGSSRLSKGGTRNAFAHVGFATTSVNEERYFETPEDSDSFPGSSHSDEEDSSDHDEQLEQETNGAHSWGTIVRLQVTEEDDEYQEVRSEEGLGPLHKQQQQDGEEEQYSHYEQECLDHQHQEESRHHHYQQREEDEHESVQNYQSHNQQQQQQHQGGLTHEAMGQHQHHQYQQQQQQQEGLTQDFLPQQYSGGQGQSCEPWPQQGDLEQYTHDHQHNLEQEDLYYHYHQQQQDQQPEQYQQQQQQQISEQNKMTPPQPFKVSPIHLEPTIKSSDNRRSSPRGGTHNLPGASSSPWRFGPRVTSPFSKSLPVSPNSAPRNKREMPKQMRSLLRQAERKLGILATEVCDMHTGLKSRASPQSRMPSKPSSPLSPIFTRHIPVQSMPTTPFRSHHIVKFTAAYDPHDLPPPAVSSFSEEGVDRVYRSDSYDSVELALWQPLSETIHLRNDSSPNSPSTVPSFGLSSTQRGRSPNQARAHSRPDSAGVGGEVRGSNGAQGGESKGSSERASREGASGRVGAPRVPPVARSVLESDLLDQAIYLAVGNRAATSPYRSGSPRSVAPRGAVWGCQEREKMEASHFARVYNLPRQLVTPAHTGRWGLR